MFVNVGQLQHIDHHREGFAHVRDVGHLSILPPKIFAGCAALGLPALTFHGKIAGHDCALCRALPSCGHLGNHGKCEALDDIHLDSR